MPLVIDVLAGLYAICRLAPDAPIPPWARGAELTAIACTPEEVSVVCAEERVPPGVRASTGWRVLKLRGPFDLAAVGVLAAVAEPLARAGVSIMAIATFDTDYVLVRDNQLSSAMEALGVAGHRVSRTLGP